MGLAQSPWPRRAIGLIAACGLLTALCGAWATASWSRGARLRHPSLSSSFVVGVASVRRSQDYLARTLASLRCALDHEAARPRVLLLNAEVPAASHVHFQALRRELEANGSAAAWRLTFLELPGMHQLLLDVNASTPAGLPRTFGDPPDRVMWRSKECLDTAELLDRATQLAPPTASWYLHLQDDIRLAPGFLGRLHAHVQAAAAAAAQPGGPPEPDVVSLFSHMEGADVRAPYVTSSPGNVGLVALAFRLAPRPGGRQCCAAAFAAFLRPRFWLEPCDWLLAKWMARGGCCMQVLVPNLVDHVGLSSSLAGKTQAIVSRSFDGSAAC